MAGISFRSKLEPHFDFIMEMKRKRETWQAIVEALAAKGVSTKKSLVYAFIKRRLKRRYPLGVAPIEKLPTVTTRPQVEIPTPEMPEITENSPPPSEFTSDPLTKPLKKKSKWNVV